MRTLSFEDIAYAADPEARASDATKRQLNSDLESQFSAQTAFSPAQYTPQPVDRDRSYAEILLSDIPKRMEATLKKLAAGDISEAERERAEIEKFAADNSQALHGFTRYTGRDKITSIAASTALDLVSGNWLTPEQKLMFDPKLNPNSAFVDARRLGLPDGYASVIEGARKGDAWDMAALLEAGQGEVVHSPVRQGEQTRQQAGQAAPAAELTSWLKYRDGAKARLGDLPQDVMSESAMTPGVVTGTLRKAFSAGDSAAGMAITDLGVRAAKNPALTDSQGKAAAFHSEIGTAAEVLSGVTYPAQVAKALSGVQSVFKAGLSGNKLAVRDIVSEIDQSMKDASGAGLGLTDQVVSSLATGLAKRTLGVRELSQSEELALSSVDDVRRLSANVLVSDDPTLPLEEADKAALAGYGVLRDGIVASVKAAGSRSLSTGKPVSESLVESVAPLSDVVMTQSGGRVTRDMADAVSRTLLRMLSSGGSLDVRNINAEIEKHPELKEAMFEHAADIVNGATGAPSSVPQAEAAKKIRTEFDAAIERVGGAGQPDGQTLKAIDEAEVGKSWDALPGDSEYNQLVEKLDNTGVGPWMRELSGKGVAGASGSDAFRVLVSSSHKDLWSAKTKEAAKKAFIAQADRPGSKYLAAKIGKQGLDALADAFVSRQIQVIESQLGQDKTEVASVASLLGEQKLAKWDTATISLGGKRSIEQTKWNDAFAALSSASVDPYSGAQLRSVADITKQVESELGPYPGSPSQTLETGGQGVDFGRMAVYMFLGRALGGGETQGVKQRELVFGKYFGEGAIGASGAAMVSTGGEMNAAKKAAEAKASSTMSAYRELAGMSPEERTLAKALQRFSPASKVVGAIKGELSAPLSPIDALKFSNVERMAARGMSDAAKAASEASLAARAAPAVGGILKVGGRLLEGLSAAAMTGTAIYDLLSKSQVPVDDTNVARRVKAFALTDFELPDTVEKAKPKEPSSGVFTASAISGMSAASSARRSETALLPSDAGKAAEIVSAMRSVSAALDKPVVSSLARKFLSTEGISEMYGSGGRRGSVGLSGKYLNLVRSEAVKLYSPNKKWGEFVSEVDAFARVKADEQRTDIAAFERAQKAAIKRDAEGIDAEFANGGGGL